uniref:putative nuclease HARBI1 isoform X2 n=1 Tax=Styela clava TaxID=7725 RepID=UPI0019395792|nr:putative nuclease HARBI1 isoform X2 [Styela clava]
MIRSYYNNPTYMTNSKVANLVTACCLGTVDPLKKWLMTPISNPNGTAAERYNIAHKKTRVIIEKAFGVLKQRWRILDHTGGKLCYTPLKVAKIIVCCVILHNMCRRNNVPLPSNGRIYPVPDTDDTAAQDDFEPTAESVRSAIVSSFSYLQ